MRRRTRWRRAGAELWRAKSHVAGYEFPRRLEPGDILTTGTPAGVGFALKPPRFLKAGDSMRLGSQILGTQQQTVREWKAT